MKSDAHSDHVLLAHSLDCIDRVFEYTAREQATFQNSRLVQDAVLRNLQTLAESTQRLSPEIKSLEPAVPWHEIAGFRNVIVHSYLGVDLEAIWLVVQNDLPPLRQPLQRLLPC